MAHHRRLYREVGAMVEANSAVNVKSAFYDWLRLIYVNDIAMAIRREVDRNPKSISLLQLIDDIARYPDVISRRRWVHGYQKFMKDIGHRDFERFAKPGAPRIDGRVIRKDRTALIEAARRVEKFVNTYIAHRNRYPMKRLPTFTELDKSIDFLGRLLQRYTLVVTQGGLTEIVPVLQEDWQAPFRVAWIPPRAVDGE
jgi:AbiU2